MRLCGYIDKYKLNGFFLIPVFENWENGKNFFIPLNDNNFIIEFENLEDYDDIWESDIIKYSTPYYLIDYNFTKLSIYIFRKSENELIIGSRFYLTNILSQLKLKEKFITLTPRKFCLHTLKEYKQLYKDYNRVRDFYKEKDNIEFDIMFLKQEIKL